MTNLLMQDFDSINDDLLIALAGWTNSIERDWIGVQDCMRAHRMPILAPTELDAILDGYAGEGFGDIRKSDDGNDLFLISLRGLREAKRRSRARKPLSLVERLRLIPRSDWISLGALIASIFAILK